MKMKIIKLNPIPYLPQTDSTRTKTTVDCITDAGHFR